MKLVVNFKTYKQASGKNAIKLAKKAERVSKSIILCPQAADMSRIKVKNPIFAQHVDDVEPGRSTGFISPYDVKQDGAKGTLLNHAEHRIPLSKIKSTVKRCHKLGLKVILCSGSLKQIKEFKKLKPYAIAFEEPSLISTGKSITKVKPKKVEEFVKLLSRTKIIPLTGAGISTKEDVKAAKKLGTKGTLVASAIVKGKTKIKDFI